MALPEEGSEGPTAAHQEALTKFVDDRWLADQMRMKPPTIRSQRFKRRHGHPHWLDIDPVYIGARPRYRLSDALDWLQRQSTVAA